MPPLIRLLILAALVSADPNEFPNTADFGDPPYIVAPNDTRNFCPPFGSNGTLYNVTAISPYNEHAGIGCATASDSWKNGAVEFWVGTNKNCSNIKNNKGMTHYHFKCISGWKFTVSESSRGAWTIALLNDTTIVKGTSQNLSRCVMYKYVGDNEGGILMFLGNEIKHSEGMKCKEMENVASLYEQPERKWPLYDYAPVLLRMDKATVKEEIQSEPDAFVPRHYRYVGPEPTDYSDFLDGSITARSKRSLTEEPNFREQMVDTCRFPEYTQGQWSNLRIDGGAIRYVYVYNADDFDNEGINSESESQGDDGADGDAEIKRRTRRESDMLMETLESIDSSKSSFPLHFNVTEFIQKHNLSDFPIDNLDAVIINLLKSGDETESNKSKDLIPSILLSDDQPDRSSTPSTEDNEDAEVDKVETYRKIARMERLWDEQLRNDIQRAFETFDYYGFPEKIHYTADYVPKHPSVLDDPAAGGNLNRPILEAWDSFKSLFGFASGANPIFPPTPPASPPPTPPNTPPRPASAVTNDQPDETEIDELLDDQTNERPTYDYDGDKLEPVNRKKRCLWAQSSSTIAPTVPGELHDVNRDKNMDTIEKFNREHDSLHLDNLPKNKNENIPVIVVAQKSYKNAFFSEKSTTYEPGAMERLINKIGTLMKGKKSRPAAQLEVERGRPAVPAYTLVFNDDVTGRQKRSTEDVDYREQMATEYREMEEMVKLAPIIAEETAEKFKSWWTNFRNDMLDYYRTAYGLTEQLNEVEHYKYPEMRPMPSVMQFLNKARLLKVPYEKALIQWRTLEREHRMWLADLEFVAFPGQNHPDVSLGDFDHTYEDIELEFDPRYPEGTAEDPTLYRVYTVPGGGPRIGARMTRRAAWQRKRQQMSGKVPRPGYMDGLSPPPSPFDMLRSRRGKRDVDEQPSPQTAEPQKYAWRCVQPVQDTGDSETIGVKFLTMGGRIYDEDAGPAAGYLHEGEKVTDTTVDGNFQQTYGCLWLVPRGPNVLEFSILATGTPKPKQDLKSFARELCTENETRGRDSGVRNKKKLRPRRRWWFTETRSEEKDRVQVSCPVPPGTVFYGVVPAPPPPQSSDPHAQPGGGARQMCARLVSAADDCQPGAAGRPDRMKYTVSDCVEQQVTVDGSLPLEVVAPPKPEDVFEERSYQCLGQWTEMQQNGPGEKSAMLTYTFAKRVDTSNPGAPEYECFVGTTIPNDPGRDPAITTTLMLTEAGTGNRCSRLADPFKSGMKLVGTKISPGTACAGTGRSDQAATNGGSWYPLRPQELTPRPDNGIGKLPFPNPSAMTPIAAGSSTRNPGKKVKEHVSVRPLTPPKENSGAVFKNSVLVFFGLFARLLIF